MKTTDSTTPNRQNPNQTFQAAKITFVSEWNTGNKPRIETFLDSLPDADRPKLLRELLAVELQRRQCDGEEPNLQDYIDRFPSFVEVVSELFEAHNSFSIWSVSTATFGKKNKEDSDPTSKIVIPKRIAERYRLIEKLGKGGFGEVWRAFDEKLNAYVAIKGPRRDRAIPPEILALAVAEARKIRQMKCDGFVPVLDVVDDGPLQFIVMELMDGGSLVPYVGKERRPSHEQTARWVATIADALHQAHLHGIVHRDIKPANILLDSDLRPHVADLGLAITEEEQLSEPSASVGTLNYMSPEQAEGHSNLVDARSDIYSLGVLLYHLLTGRVPHLTQRLSDYCRLVQKPGGPRPPRTIDDSIPRELEAICRKCLAYDVNDRYTTARDLSEALKGWLNRGSPPSKKKWLVLGGVLVTAGIAGAFAVVPSMRTPPKVTVHTEQLFYQDLPLQAIQLGVWYGLHQRPPAQLHGVDHPPLTSCFSDRRLKTVTVSSRDSVLFALGNAPHRKYSFEVEISQSNWRGRCGVFFGYRKTNGEFGSQAKFQLLHLQLSGVAIRRPKLAMYRTVNWIKDDKRGFVETTKSTEWKMEFAATPKRLTGRLELTVANGVLTDLIWAGDRLPVLCGPEWNKQLKLSPEDYVGQFGVYNFASDGVYQNARIRCD